MFSNRSSLTFNSRCVSIALRSREYSMFIALLPTGLSKLFSQSYKDIFAVKRQVVSGSATETSF